MFGDQAVSGPKPDGRGYCLQRSRDWALSKTRDLVGAGAVLRPESLGYYGL